MTSQKNNLVRLGIIYPADPLGSIPGGIDTFIRGIISWAPEDIEIALIGVTTDRYARPVGKWTRCRQGRREFDFLPLYSIDDPGKRSWIPATVQYTALLLKEAWWYQFDVLDSHRIEPFLPYLFGKTPKNVFIHQNMEVINSKDSDIRWKHFPWLYYKIEAMFLRRLDSIFMVREDAVQVYRQRYSEIRDRFNFVPTWMDPDVFFPAKEAERALLRKEMLDQYGIPEDSILMIFVGRLDKQKDPFLLVDAFSQIVATENRVHLFIIGDGVLRDDAGRRIDMLGLADKVTLAGLLSPVDVARRLRGADLFALSSAYEGMPMCVLEAMGCGLPVATTDVGEVRRVVRPGVNGEIALVRTAEALANAMRMCVKNLHVYSGMPCIDATIDYVPEKVLVPIYENYRRLARG